MLISTTFQGGNDNTHPEKQQLDAEYLNNYRPEYNLPFVSKVTEPVVAAQFCNSVGKPLQSAYRQCHSTETALVYVINDIVL